MILGKYLFCIRALRLWPEVFFEDILSFGFPLQKYFKRNYLMGGGCSDVDLMSPSFSGCSPTSGCGPGLPNFGACAEVEGGYSMAFSSKIPVSHCRAATLHSCGEGLHHVWHAEIPDLLLAVHRMST